MTAIASADIRNVALIGHKGSGKTSLAEAMLFVAKATPKLGKVDDKSSMLDDTAEEKEHAASLEASVAYLTWNGKKVNVVDTPGEGSFLAETRLALGAVDAAILVVSGKDGVQPITERVFAWTRQLGLPCVVVRDQGRRRERQARRGRRRDQDPPQGARRRARAPRRRGPRATRAWSRCARSKAWVGKPEAPGNVVAGAHPRRPRPATSRRRAASSSTTSPAPATSSPRSTSPRATSPRTSSTTACARR